MKLLSIFAVTCLGILVYSNTIYSPFHFDDFNLIVDNPWIRHLQNVQDIWNWWPCRFITFLSFAFNYHFHRLNVTGYHLFNLAVHICAALLVCWLVRLTLATPVMKEERISRHSDLIALFAGLVFVSHPLQTQAVTFIWQRAASMAAMFYIASLCLYVKSRLLHHCHGGRNEAIFYTGSLITAILAMLTKENAITLPLMVLLYESCFFKTKKGLTFKPLIPFLFVFLMIPAAWLFSSAERFQARHSYVANISSIQYFLTETRVMIAYIKLLFLPLHQNLDYDFSLSKSIFEGPVLFSMAFLAAVFYFAIRMFSKYRLISFSIFWLFLTLLPESSFFPFADVIVEHRLYLPLAGFSLFLVSGIYYLMDKDNFRLMLLVLLMFIAGNSVLAYQRNKVWRDDLTLWEDTVQGSPNKARPLNNLGEVYLDLGNFTIALSYLNRAIEADPGYATAYFNRGLVYYNLNDLKKAWSNVRHAQRLGYAVKSNIIKELTMASIGEK